MKLYFLTLCLDDQFFKTINNHYKNYSSIHYFSSRKITLCQLKLKKIILFKMFNIFHAYKLFWLSFKCYRRVQYTYFYSLSSKTSKNAY